MAYRGNQLLWTGYLVCTPCYDVPFQLNRPMFLPPDPPPQIPSRPPFWQQEMASGYVQPPLFPTQSILSQGGQPILTEDDEDIIV